MKIGNNDVTTLSITGTIGVGKSLLGQILEEKGIPVIDTDKIVHELLNSDSEIKKQIRDNFPAVFEKVDNAKEEQISRKKLAKIIFSDKEAKTKLESILHPRVRQICLQLTIELANSSEKPKLIVTLVPLLFESKRQSDYDYVWAVICKEDMLLERLAKRDGFSAEEIKLRLAGQMSQEQKAKLANKVLDNSKDKNYLQEQAFAALAELGISLGK